MIRWRISASATISYCPALERKRQQFTNAIISAIYRSGGLGAVACRGRPCTRVGLVGVSDPLRVGREAMRVCLRSIRSVPAWSCRRWEFVFGRREQFWQHSGYCGDGPHELPPRRGKGRGDARDARGAGVRRRRSWPRRTEESRREAARGREPVRVPPSERRRGAVRPPSSLAAAGRERAVFLGRAAPVGRRRRPWRADACGTSRGGGRSRRRRCA